MPTQDLLEIVKSRNAGEPEFHQAVEEVLHSVMPVVEKNPKYREHKILERLVEPERVISFRVPWVDDKGEIQVNRGFRIQMNSALGPYKGGLRFHPSVNYSILKFLGFEQVFKNALTGLSLGGGKGGSDFDPKGKSSLEVMRFCQSFMTELARFIGHRVDVPAGDIGVGGREIGFLFGSYKKITNEFSGILTGKGVGWGGSLIRTEATGYGVIYFASYMLDQKGDSIEGKTCLVSGSGNVAQYCLDKILQQGGKPVTASDSGGFIFDEEGMNQEKLDFLKDLKNNRRGRISEYADKYPSATFTSSEAYGDHNPLWDRKADCAFPCATQNEINQKDVENMISNGVKILVEGANMPCTIDAVNALQDSSVLYAPGKASNAGGVGTSGLEMIQNYSGDSWPAEKVDRKLQEIMKRIHQNALQACEQYGRKDDYLFGANVAGFTRVAEAMIAQGVV